MPLNIQIQKDELDYLANLNEEKWRLTMMPMKNISENNKSSEDTYIFSIKTGNILFCSINGIYQISSCTDNTPKRTIIEFAKVCEAHDIAYVSLGFEPDF